MRYFLFALLLFALAVNASASGTLIIGNKGEDTVSFIDLNDGRELARPRTGPQPHEVAVSPDGLEAAVVAYGGTTIDIFEIRKRERIRTIDLAPHKAPHGIVWLPDGRIVVTTERSQSLAIIDTNNGDKVSAIPTGQEISHMVAVAPDAARAYVANIRSGTVTAIDLKKNEKIRDLPAGKEPEGLALTPDGNQLWVADRGGDTVHVFDTRELKETARIDVGKTPIRLVISPDGRTAITSNFGTGDLTMIDVADRRVARTIAVSGAADAQQVTILFSTDGSRLYVAETGRDRVAEVDVAAGKVLRHLPAGKNGDGLAIAP
jgi:YVTN family beta-propeller protein